MTNQPLVENAILRAQWQEEFEQFSVSSEAMMLHDRLKAWNAREVQKKQLQN